MRSVPTSHTFSRLHTHTKIQREMHTCTRMHTHAHAYTQNIKYHSPSSPPRSCTLGTKAARKTGTCWVPRSRPTSRTLSRKHTHAHTHTRERDTHTVSLSVSSSQILYTGDYSCEEDRHLMAAEIPPNIPHILLVESTYGVQVHEPQAEREARFTCVCLSSFPW